MEFVCELTLDQLIEKKVLSDERTAELATAIESRLQKVYLADGTELTNMRFVETFCQRGVFNLLDGEGEEDIIWKYIKQCLLGELLTPEERTTVKLSLVH